MLRAVAPIRNLFGRANSAIPLQSTESATPLAHFLNMATYSSTISKAPEAGAIPEEASTKPHHVLKKGRLVKFKNPYPSFGEGIKPINMWKLILWPRITGKMKAVDTSPPTVPVVKPTFLPDRTASDKLRATWLGHACYYVEFPSGLRVLFDPVFEDRCSPFAHIGPKRFTERPCGIGDIPVVDAVLISHSHYDHLSHGSVLEVQKHHPNAHFFVGKGLESWFKQTGIKKVTELDWWEDAGFELSMEKKSEGDASPETISAAISCTPCQHTSNRGIFDRDTTLWCSWAVKSGGKSVWFGGDTGYRAVPIVPDGVDDYGPEFEALPTCPQFKQIGELRGPFDLGLIPIGAYYPRAAFSGMHANPFDSVEIFQDTKCEKAMGIHWGTWALTMEEVLDPPRQLKAALKKKGIAETGIFDICDIGESREF